jgi:uncharacterized repeat protein (TIGR01451 family)
MKRLGIILTLGLFLTAIQALAQGQPKLQLDISEKKLNMTAEEKSGKAAVSYAPGDTIEYKILAKNAGTGVMAQPEVVDPVPEGVRYVIDSARGENCRIVFSVNKGMAYAVWPVMVSATNANGVKIERPARNEEVTHIKWVIKDKLAPGSQKELTFRAVVE